MNRTARVLVFPVSVAAVMASEACGGVSIDDPSVKACHADTTEVLVQFPNGQVAHDTVIQRNPWKNCRAA